MARWGLPRPPPVRRSARSSLSAVDAPRGADLESPDSRAGVTQLAECLLPKQDVAGSNPVSRSNPVFRWRFARTGVEGSSSNRTRASVTRNVPRRDAPRQVGDQQRER